VLLLAFACAWIGASSPAAARERSGQTTFRFPHQHAEASDVAVEAGRVIVVGGIAYTKRNIRFALVRVLPNGDLDPGFGDHGRVMTDFGEISVLVAIAIQPDGKIVAAGYGGGATLSSPHDFLVARYLPDGSLDPTFGSEGGVRVDFGGNDLGTSLDIENDGSIVVAGG
jgi:uncharacterized delta-60 repeat protein